MKRYELSISPNYVSTWSLWEALRELYQNVLDEVQTNESALAIFKYDRDTRTLRIGNRGSILSASTLLLGATNKEGDENMIGQYGEGYKLALLILVREGYRVKIYNGDVMWTPKLVHSKTFNSEVLVIDEHTLPREDRCCRLIYEISGVLPSTMHGLKDKFLFLTYPEKKDVITVNDGAILLHPSQKGRVYVRGLFVCDMVSQGVDKDKIAYGYDLLPCHLQLDRDRRKLTEFNLFWETSRLIHAYARRCGEVMEEGEEMPLSAQDIRLLIKDCLDAQFVHNFGMNGGMMEDITDMAFNDFLKKYGRYAVPVQNDQEASVIRKRYKGLVTIQVPAKEYVYITASPAYREAKDERVPREEASPEKTLKDFGKTWKKVMPKEMKAEFERIVRKSKRWTEVMSMTEED